MIDWPTHHPSDDDLARAARNDALRDAPRFSPALHERVMAAVGSADRSPRQPRFIATSPWAMASAAAVMICIGLLPGVIRSRLAQRAAPLEAMTPHVASGQAFALGAPPVPATLASWGRGESALEADLGPSQLAGLDHDARLAARYVLDPLSLPLASGSRQSAAGAGPRARN